MRSTALSAFSFISLHSSSVNPIGGVHWPLFFPCDGIHTKSMSGMVLKAVWALTQIPEHGPRMAVLSRKVLAEARTEKLSMSNVMGPLTFCMDINRLYKARSSAM